MSERSSRDKKKREALTPRYCEIPDCAYAKIVQRHRIFPGSEGGKYRLGNVIGLCPNHHGEADRGWIPASELKEIVRRRLERNGIQEDCNQGTEPGGSRPSQCGSDPAAEPASGTGDSTPDAADDLDSGSPSE